MLLLLSLVLFLHGKRNFLLVRPRDVFHLDLEDFAAFFSSIWGSLHSVSLRLWTLESHLVDLVLISLLSLNVELLYEFLLLFLHGEDVRCRDLLIGVIFRERGRYSLILVLEQFVIDWIE